MATLNYPDRLQGEESDRSMKLVEYLDMIRRRKWYLVGFVLLAITMGVAYLSQVDPDYKVGSRILVQRQNLSLAQERFRETGEEFLATQAEIIRSPAVVARAVQTLALPAPGPDDLDPMSAILRALTVRPVLGTNVLGIGYHAGEPAEAVRTVEAIIASYRDYLRVMEQNSHIEVLHLLTQTEKDMRSELRLLEQQYLEVHQNSPLLGQGRDSAEVQKALLTDLGAALTETQTQRMDLENQIEMLSNQPRELITLTVFETPLPPDPAQAVETAAADHPDTTRMPDVAWEVSVDGGPETRDLRGQLLRAQVRDRELAAVYGPKHPAVRAVREEVAATEALLWQCLDATPNILEKQLAMARRQEQRLEEKYETEFTKVKGVDAYAIREQQMLNDIERVQTSHQSALAQLTDWQMTDQALAEGQTGVTISVLEAPALSGRQVWPPPALLLAACAVLGFVGGFATITLLERTDTKVRSSKEIQQLLNLPVIGRIPTIPAPRRGRANRLHRGRWVERSPQSSVAEAFRALRTRLNVESPIGSGRVLQIGSPSDGEGKSTVTANLAFSFAQLGKRVVVVDTDLRSGCAHEMFGVSTSKGLTSVLEQGMPVDDAIQRSPLASIDVLARGPDVTNPAELLAQPVLEKVLESLRQDYDLVLLDTPPLLSAAEATMLAHKTDGVLLSLMVDRSNVEEAESARELLDTVGAKPLGIVINQVPAGKRNSYYGKVVTPESRVPDEEAAVVA